MQLNNVPMHIGIVKKFIFRYLNVPLTNPGNIFMRSAIMISNKVIELNKFLNNVCIIRV